MRKAGKLLSREDAAAIRKLRDDILAKGKVSRDDANKQAVDKFLADLERERFELVSDIEQAGGKIPEKGIAPSKLAQKDMFGAQPTKQALADLERKKDLARNTGQEEVETGDEGDLFSEARKQQDLQFSIKNEFERELVDVDPENPIAVTAKYGAVVESARTSKPTGIRRMMNWMKDRDNIGIVGSLAAVPQTKLPDFIRYGMDSLPQYTRMLKRMDGYMNGLMAVFSKAKKRIVNKQNCLASLCTLQLYLALMFPYSKFLTPPP
jgi:hypothetical protein